MLDDTTKPNDRNDYIRYPPNHWKPYALHCCNKRQPRLISFSKMQFLRRPQKNPPTWLPFPSIHHFRINMMTSIPNFSIDVYLLDTSTSPQMAVPTAATGADISLSQAAGRVLPDDGSSGRARRGSSKRWRYPISQDWSNSEFESFAVRGCLRFDVSLCGCRMDGC